MAGDDDAVHVLGVLVVGEELREHVRQLLQRRGGVGLDGGGAHVEQHALTEDDIAVAADADPAAVAHHAAHVLPDLLQDAQAQHRDGLHLAPHGQQLLAGGLEIVLLLPDQRGLVRQKLVLRGQRVLLGGQLLLLLRQRQPRLVQIDGDLRKVALRLRHLLQRQGEGIPGFLQRLLRAAQIVAGDEVLDIAEQHQEEQDQRHRAHHIRIGRPEALLPIGGPDHGVAAALVLPLHFRPSMRRSISRSAVARSRTARSMRSTLPRRL